MYENRIRKIQEYLKEKNIDGYLLTICDDHGSEYIPSFYKSVAFLSGFTGSAGTLLILKEQAFLWTDGRYFLQAAEELKKSKVTLKKIGVDESIEEFIAINVKKLACDFKTMKTSFILSLKKQCPYLKLIDEDQLLHKLWKNRPKLSNSPVFIIPRDKTLMRAKDKWVKTITKFKHNGDCGVIVTALDDIAYITNLRSCDIKYNPVLSSFLFIKKINNQLKCTIYIPQNKLNKELSDYLRQEEIETKSYNQIYEDIKNANFLIYYNADKTNYKLYNLMENKRNVVLYPTLRKAIKGKIEISESKKVHIKDGIAMCKFIYYLKKHINQYQMNEMSVSNYLAKLRKKQGAIELSFTSIVGYLDHGAIVHYAPSYQSAYPIKNEGFLLVDSGAHYLYGTTDVTRTIAFKNITEEMKKHYTLVLKSHIALASAIFDLKTTDAQLDLIARKPLWDENLDYNHGTGHGVGHLLNVHEGPQSIRYNKKNPVVMKKGMITSNEPGLYFSGKYGIRLENEILCVSKKNGMLGFETITYVPFDLDAIEVKMLTKQEKIWLNQYHQMVYQIIAPYLRKCEQNYLKYATREI